jgi:hypothetical protein
MNKAAEGRPGGRGLAGGQRAVPYRLDEDDDEGYAHDDDGALPAPAADTPPCPHPAVPVKRQMKQALFMSSPGWSPLKADEDNSGE